MPKISVCIPTYESAGTLGRAIRSAFSQNNCDIEVVIGDNASTDSTERVVKEFDASRVVYFRHSTNIGYPANVNSCLERASGDYIFILCADDFLTHDGVFAELLAELQAAPQAVASHVPFQLYQQGKDQCLPTGRPFSPLAPGVLTPRQVFASFTEGRGCFGWGWLFRRDLVSHHGLRFEIDHDMAPDTMFWLTVSMKGPIAEARSGRPGYAFVMHDDSLGGRIFNERALKVYEQLLTFERRLFERLRQELPEVALELSSRQYRYSTCEFAGLVQKGFREGRLTRGKALKLLGQSARRHPRAALNLRFARNLVFILLPEVLRRIILAARRTADASPLNAA
jgi:glycosyltransferase involved in cell wall biosynthesis